MSAGPGAGPALCPTLLHRGAGAAIALPTEGSGFTRVAVYEDGAGVVQHAEPAYGVEILMPPTDQDYGVRDCLARDPEGNVRSFGSYVPATAG
ncbi:hypothetical protein [Streptomyces cucumeris]|uniref:hypothetical protein n=1 Tax=Streptomyces cucumeris TaxID=2962890 RepID=UPI003D704CB5